MIVISLLIYSSAESGFLGNIGKNAAHLLHNHYIHYVLMLLGLWPFFARLGAELELDEVAAAGLMIFAAILGGMIVPVAMTTLLLMSFASLPFLPALAPAVGAMATDVPMGLGAFGLYRRVVRTAFIAVAGTALMMLAIGDDLAGVIGMLAAVPAFEGLGLKEMVAEMAVYAESHGSHGHDDHHSEETANGTFLMWAFFGEAIFLTFLWFSGQGGKYSTFVEGVRTRTVFQIDGNGFWMLMAVLNTAYLALCGIEPILGGCLVLIFAPKEVKDWVKNKFEGLSIWMLAFFALVAGSVNIFTPEVLSWDFMSIALLVTAGGFGGKVIGITFFSLTAQKFMDPDDTYGRNNFPPRAILMYAIPAGCNGTVAIIFVSVLLKEGFMTDTMAAQAKIGYLLTVPVSYITVLITRIFWASDEHQAIRDI